MKFLECIFYQSSSKVLDPRRFNKQVIADLQKKDIFYFSPDRSGILLQHEVAQKI